MTPLKRWLKRTAEKLLARYDEGPEAPARLTQMVVDFADHNPRATRGEWAEFAAAHAAECYRTGWVRGAEYIERVPEVWRPDVPPEEVADSLDPEWRHSPPVILDPRGIPPEEPEPDGMVMGRNLRRYGAA
jgi:hypothetical protein